MNNSFPASKNASWPWTTGIEPSYDSSVAWPKITIITPSYNQGQYLEETILSILNQKYPNLEYIVIDGGSTDNSVEVIQQYKSEIDYWISEKDKGQSDAINKGFRKATGDIVNWINSDDLLSEGALYKVAKAFMSHKDVDFVHGQFYFFTEKGEVHLDVTDKSHYEIWMYGGVCLPQPSTFYSMELLNKVGYLDETLHYSMDYDLFVKMLLVSKKDVRIDDVLSLYRLHDTSKTVSQKVKFLPEKNIVYSRFLRSVHADVDFINKVKSYGLYTEDDVTYTTTKVFSKEALTESLCALFRNYIHIYFQVGKFSAVKKYALGTYKEDKTYFDRAPHIRTLYHYSTYLGWAIHPYRFFKRILNL